MLMGWPEMEEGNPREEHVVAADTGRAERAQS
jgi:hypothetical protein